LTEEEGFLGCFSEKYSPLFFQAERFPKFSQRRRRKRFVFVYGKGGGGGFCCPVCFLPSCGPHDLGGCATRSPPLIAITSSGRNSTTVRLIIVVNSKPLYFILFL
jgi:hypothetical protein